MEQATFTAIVRVERPPQARRIIGAVLLIVLVALLMVGIALGFFFSLILLIPLFLLALKEQRARRTTETKAAPVEVRLSKDEVTITLQGAQIRKGMLVDQRFSCPRSSLERVAIDANGTFYLRSNRLTKTLMDGNAELAQSTYQGEVRFRPTSPASLEDLKALFS